VSSRGEGRRLILVGGMDPSGGAGLLRDSWVAQKWLCADDYSRHRGVLTAWTHQGYGRAATAEPCDLRNLDWVLREWTTELLSRDLRSGERPRWVIKLGLIPGPCCPRLGEWLCDLRSKVCLQVVLDPVLRASDGGQLGSRVSALMALMDQVDLLTPNGDEARALSLKSEPLGTRKKGRSPAAVLFKNLACDDSYICDRLESIGGEYDFIRPKISGPDPRGTGCSLATAIACALLQGREMRAAVQEAITWLDSARTRLRRAPDGRYHLE